MTDDIMIEVENLTKRYAGKTAVEDVSFTVGRGEIVALLGPNGAGKTTVFYMVVGLLPATAGRVLLDGRDLATFASRGQQRTAILALKLAELDLLTALDGRPPLLLLDDVFSELDPARRVHLVRRIAELPQALITTTDPDDIDPDLRRRARPWRVVPGGDEGAAVVEGGA